MSLEDERRQLIERKRNLVYLIGQYLAENGLNNTRNTLVDEYKMTEEYQVCDNIDLDTIYMDFCSFFQLKFGKKPKILKKINENRLKCSIMKQLPRKERIPSKGQLENVPEKGENNLNGLLVVSSTNTPPIENEEGMANGKVLFLNNSRLNFQSDFNHFSQEWKDIADIISRDIIKQDLNAKWSDIFGAELAKNILKESILLPLEHPELFNTDDGLQPWKSVLLHGPPGIGKTLLAKSLCSETNGKVTFFNISSSTVTSKWRGESEKYIRVLFQMAQLYSPSIIFIDEIDSLTSKRDSIYEHESSKRFKNEFLTLIDGLNGNSRVFLLCNSNMPWDIDVAFLRRFEQKILIGLPSTESRLNMIKHFLPATQSWPEKQILQLAELSDGFTGDELRIVCKEVQMVQIRKYTNDNTTFKKGNVPIPNFLELKSTIESFRPANNSGLLQKHIDWNRNYGRNSCSF